MAFPVIAAAGADYSTSGSVVSHPVPLPSGTAAGDLLIAQLSPGASTTVTWPAGWAPLADLTRLGVAYRAADGTEGSTVTVTTGAGVQAVGKTWRLTGQHATSPPEAATASGSSNTPDPPNLAPSWGGSEDVRWLLPVGASNGSAGTSVSSYPSSYADDQSAQSLASQAFRAFCSRGVSAGAENPGAYTLSASRSWSVATIAVRPASGGGVTLDGAAATVTASAAAGTLAAPLMLAAAAVTLAAAAPAATFSTPVTLTAAAAPAAFNAPAGILQAPVSYTAAAPTATFSAPPAALTAAAGLTGPPLTLVTATPAAGLTLAAAAAAAALNILTSAQAASFAGIISPTPPSRTFTVAADPRALTVAADPRVLTAAP